MPSGATWTGASGSAELKPRRAVTPNTVFAVASITKTFVAALVLIVAGVLFGFQLGVFFVIAGVLLVLNVGQRWLVETLKLRLREGLVREQLATAQIVCAFAPGHPLEDKVAVSAGDLEAWPMVRARRPAAMRRFGEVAHSVSPRRIQSGRYAGICGRSTQVPFRGVPVGAHRYVWSRPYTDREYKALQRSARTCGGRDTVPVTMRTEIRGGERGVMGAPRSRHIGGSEGRPFRLPVQWFASGQGVQPLHSTSAQSCRWPLRTYRSSSSLSKVLLDPRMSWILNRPESPAQVWNFKGYMNNAWHRVRVIVV